MKILFISRRFPHAAVTGGHVIVHQRLRRLAQRGHEVGLACFGTESDRPSGDELRPLLCELQLVPPPPRQTPLQRAARFLAASVPSHFYDCRSLQLMRCVGDMVERSRYDVVVAEFSAMGQYLYGNPYLPAVRKVISCHSSIAAGYRKVAELRRFSPRGWRSRLSLWRGLEAYEQEMYRNVDRVLVLTAQERYGLQSLGPGLRVAVIPPGVDTTYFQPDPAVTPTECVLFSGHYEVEDNRDAVRWFVSRTWPLVRARHPGLKFCIVGPGAREHFASLGRRDPAIDVVGEVADLRPYLHKAKVFVCPVRLGSGLRVKLLEAMAAGVPVVTTMLGAEGIPLHPGDTGFLADRTDLMASYMDLLLGDEELRQRIARQARDLVAERFAWDHCIDLLENVLADVMQGR